MGKTYPLSEEFIEAFRDGIGTIRATCELCGRFYIAARNNHYEEGEYDEFLKKAEKEPLKYIVDSASDGFSLGSIEGKQFVIDCECLPETLGKFEAWIWNHGEKIAEYLKKRGDRELKAAQAKVKAVTVKRDT